jgi:hypothetical protein
LRSQFERIHPAPRDHPGRQISLERKPDVYSAVLGAGTTAIAGCGEKAVMTAGRCVRMIVTILGHRVWLGIVAVHIRLRRSVIIAMLRRHLSALIVRAILRTDS